jgi:hypothetical protein
MAIATVGKFVFVNVKDGVDGVAFVVFCPNDNAVRVAKVRPLILNKLRKDVFTKPLVGAV